MPRIRFTAAVTVEQGDGNGPHYEAGQHLSCSVASALYWQGRGVAEPADDLPPAPEEEAPPSAVEDPPPAAPRKVRGKRGEPA